MELGGIKPPRKEKNMGKILNADIINEHFDRDAKRIKRTAMPEAVKRLLAMNEEERQKFLHEFESFGEVNCKTTGQQWTLIPHETYKSRLKFWRKEKGLTQAELAERSGVNIRLIQHYEQGVKDINKAQVVTVLNLAEALDVDVYAIINDR